MTARINAALAAVLVLVLVLLAVVLIGGSRVLPWTTRAERTTDAYADVQVGATRAVLAFLDVDFRQMDAKIKKVESVSTGDFGQQYAHTAVELKAAAEQAHAVSHGDVRYVGVNTVKGRTAKALVAADVVVSNTSTKANKATKSCPHAGARCDSYRFQVTLTRVGDTWKMSNLAGVS